MTQPLVAPQVPHPRTQLSAVPNPGQPADRRAEVARWVVTLTEPLMTTQDRSKVDEDMAAFINRNRDWSIVYFAGLLTDLAHTLPADDPWRHLSAMIDLDQVAIGQPATDPDQKLVWSGTAPVPSATGAVIKTPGGPARSFGTSIDTLDLVTQDVTDTRSAPSTVAVATNLTPLSAAFVAMASSDARTMQVVLSKTFHALWLANFGSLTPDTAGESLLKTAGQAVQWIEHRRRQYLMEDDGYAYTAGLAWMGKADRVNAGKPITGEKTTIQLGKIDANAYKDLRSDSFDN